MDFKFKRHRIDKISRDKIIEELNLVAKHFQYKDFKKKDFDKVSEISGSTVIREFGTWEKALTFLKNHLKQQGIELKPSNRKSRKQYTEQQLFDEMERIWKSVGHRPSINEWNACGPKISFATYMRYFDGWQNACLKFIEYKMGGSILSDDEMAIDQGGKRKEYEDSNEPKLDKSRTIPLGIRLKVLDRDNFRCMFCGRSPATDLGVKLHIDHIVPLAKGGNNDMCNLQILCEKCNKKKLANEWPVCSSVPEYFKNSSKRIIIPK